MSPILLYTSLLKLLLLHHIYFENCVFNLHFSKVFSDFLLIFLLNHCFYSSTLFSFHVFLFSQSNFWNLFLFLCPCGKKTFLDIISILLNLFKFVLWAGSWPILENVPYALEKDVCSTLLGWNVLWISIKSNLSKVSFKTTISLLIFCLDISGVSKSPPTILLLVISFFMSVNICFMYLSPPYWVYICIDPFLTISLSSLPFAIDSILKSILPDMGISIHILFPFAWNIFFLLLIFSHFMSLTLMRVSCKKHIDFF